MPKSRMTLTASEEYKAAFGAVFLYWSKLEGTIVSFLGTLQAYPGAGDIGKDLPQRFDSKIELLEHAIRVCFANCGSLRDKYIGFCKRASEAHTRRNRLAHGYIFTDISDDSATLFSKKREFTADILDLRIFASEIERIICDIHDHSGVAANIHSGSTSPTEHLSSEEVQAWILVRDVISKLIPPPQPRAIGIKTKGHRIRSFRH